MRTILTTLAPLFCLITIWACSSPRAADQEALTTPIVKVSQTELPLPSLLARNELVGTADEQQQVKQTYATLTAAIQADPTDYRRRLQLAQLFMLEARATGQHGYYYPATLEILDEIIAEAPPKDVIFGAVSLQASVYLSLHQFAKAKEIAQYAISLNGYNAVIYGSLVDAHVELGEYEQAVQMADKMMSIRPDLRSYSRVSYLREIHGDIEGAIEAMEMAVSAGYPGYEETAWARLTLGNLYEQQGKLAAASLQYERILAERPNYPFAMAALARIDVKKAAYAQAEQRLLQAITIIPEVSFYEQLAGLYQTLGRTQEADSLIQETLLMLADDEANGHTMDMTYAEVHLQLTGKLDLALQYAQKEYNQRPLNIDANRMMAEILLQQGHPELARSYVETAMHTGSQNPRLWCVAGIVFAQTEAFEQGQQMIQQSFALDPYQQHTLVSRANQTITN